MNIKQALLKNNLTQKQAADICGVSLRTVQYWCTKNKMPLYAYKLLKLLDI